MQVRVCLLTGIEYLGKSWEVCVCVRVLFYRQRRLSDQRALLEEETVLRKRAEGKCVEIRVKCKSLETELESANHALSESAKTIQDQMVGASVDVGDCLID